MQQTMWLQGKTACLLSLTWVFNNVMFDLLIPMDDKDLRQCTLMALDPEVVSLACVSTCCVLG